MSFGGSPWQRNVGSYQQQGGPQSMYMQQQYGQNQMQSGNMYSNSNSMISYPPSGGGGGGGGGNRMNSAGYTGGNNGGAPQRYNSIGTVTKISSDYGLVNDEVLFYRNVVKGSFPKLGERVLFEATYSTTGQYEWTATRIQLMTAPGVPPLMGTNVKNSASDFGRGRASPRRSPPSRSDFRRDERRDKDRVRSRDREDDQMRKRRREDHDRSRERPGLPKKQEINTERKEKDRLEREREQRERERDLRELRERERANRDRAEKSPFRAPAKGRRPAVVRRYMVQIPRHVLTYKSADIHLLRQRYSNLYIPSDFFYAKMKWSETFTPDNPFSLRRPCQFHIMHPVVEAPVEQKLEDLEPADANFAYSAKVMLLSLPSMVEMYQKCLESEDDDGSVTKLHPSRLISFLVGTRGYNEPLAIGGPWSPSLDGENPEEDPAVLIRTAIRTCRALTGIDLSNCTQWYRFVEFYYHRNDHIHYKSKSHKEKDKEEEPHIETVVIYLPDIHSCMPSTPEWEKVRETYKTACEDHISRKNAAAKANAAKAAKEGDKGSKAAEDTETSKKNDETSTSNDDKDKSNVGSSGGLPTKNDGNAATANAEQTEPMAVDGDDNNEKGKNPEATHYSKLDMKALKLQQIRDELSARGLPSTGAKNALVARLTKALAQEKSNEAAAQKKAEEDAAAAAAAAAELEENGDDNQEQEDDDDNKIENTTNDAGDIDMNDMVVVDEYDSNKQEENTREMSEKEKSWLTRRYTLPEAPHIIVNPNKNAKGGKFDCAIMTLQSLLNYLPGDSKERCFEVYVFAELFNEMLMRDFGFNIYKEICFYKGALNDDSSDKKSENNEKQENGVDEKAKEDHDSNESKSHSEANEDKTSGKTKSTAKDNEKEKVKEKGRDKEKDKEKEKEKDKEKDKIEKKMVIVKPHLLLSFIYFDTTQRGSIFEQDLEDLFSTLGLDLSRGQIRKTLSRLGAVKSFLYRKLTDREEPVNAEPVIEDLDDVPMEELRDLALGNKIYGIADDDYWEGDRTTTTTEEGMVEYNGTIVHIAKLMDQINRTEKNYTDMDKLYNDLHKQHNELQKEHSRGQTKIKDLLSDVKNLTRKLNDANSEISSLNRKYRDQQNTLQFIYNRVQPYFAREKDKDAKSESSKDKEIKEEKDKDKDKDKKKENGKDVKDNKEKEEKSKDVKDKDIKEKEIKEEKTNDEKSQGEASPSKVEKPEKDEKKLPANKKNVSKATTETKKE